MRISIEKLPERFPAGKLPAFLFYTFFFLYLGIHFGLEAGIKLCWFKALTGINCPTCGLSRSFIALLHGDILRAVLYNPLMLIFTLTVLLQQSSTILFKRRLAIQTSEGEQRMLLFLFLFLFIANWIYVIFTLK